MSTRIRNIPNRYSQRDLIAELEDMGYIGSYYLSWWLGLRIQGACVLCVSVYMDVRM